MCTQNYEMKEMGKGSLADTTGEIYVKGSQLKMENDGTFEVALKGPNVKRAIERTKRLRDQGSLKSWKQTVLPLT